MTIMFHTTFEKGDLRRKRHFLPTQHKELCLAIYTRDRIEPAVPHYTCHGSTKVP